MAIGDPFGALDAEPEEDWRYKEAIDGLKNDPSQQPQQPASSWYDTLNDVTHFPHRIIGALTAPRQDTPPGRLSVLRNVADVAGSTLKNAFTASHRVMTGELDPESPEGIGAALDMASLGGASVAGALERGAASPGVDLRILGKKVLSDSAPTAAPIALAEHAQPFYSGLEHAVSSVPQGSMSGQQWLGTLANKAGVKPEELDWTGARDMLTANADKPVTKAQLQDHLDANKVQLGEVTKEHMPESWKDVPSDIQYKLADMHRDNYFDGRYGGVPDLPDWYESIAQHSREGNETGIDDFFNPPRFTEYTLPGGKNYREKLLTLPARPSTPEEILDRAKKEAKLQYPEDSFEDLPEPIRNGYLKFGEQLQPSSYKGPHWEERNVLGHLRMTDRDVAGSAPLDADAVTAFNDHQAKIEALRDQQGAVGRQIGAAAKPFEAARQAKLRADYASGKLTGPQFQQQSMNYVDHPDLAPLQDKLQQLRAAEDELRKSEDQYVKHLGPEEGRKRFANEFAHTMAATTGGADPTSNLLLAHYVQWASRHGGIPEASHQLPFPIGGRYVSGNIKQFQKMPEEGGFTEANPKRHDFAHAFLGHTNKATMDEQMSGGLVPGMQAPPQDSYGVAAQVVHDLAKKNGVAPRDFQDITWAGLKKMKVGDKFKYKGPMIQDVNDAIERTHRLTGMPRNEIVRRGVVKKEIPLYSGPAPLGALDAQQMSPEESEVRSHGSVRFDPNNGSDQSKDLLKNLPDDIEKIDRGNTIELRLKKAVPTS